MEQIIHLFSTHVSLDNSIEKQLMDKWVVRKELKRGEILVAPGKSDTNLYYVESGSLRIYYPHQEEEHCVGFGYENTVLCAYPSFLSNQPSSYCIQAIKASKLIGIKRNDFFELLYQSTELERAWRQITEEALLGKIERETEMLTFTPQERLERLMKRSPHLFQIIPRKYIASYLRMSPETLSRIRL